MTQSANLTEVIKALNSKIALEPENASLYFQRASYHSLRADCYLELEKYKEAIDDYIKAGACFKKIKKYKEAIECYNKALNYTEAHNSSFNDKLLKTIYVDRGYCYQKNMDYTNALANFSELMYLDPNSAEVSITKFIYEKEIDDKIEERNKVIADLSHSIKNLISTVIDPLVNLKNETVIKPQIIDNALRGANLIRGIVNAVNLSFKGSVDDFYYDAKHNTSKDKTDLKAMLIESLKQSVANMFDGKYFSNFNRKYFPSKLIFLEAQSAWVKVSQSNNLDVLNPFFEQYFFKTDISFENAETFSMGNDKGSALKLMILFQEIILNAVKYSSFVNKEDRLLQIYFTSDMNHISVKVENPYRTPVKSKTTGIGHVIINNFAKLMNAEPVITKEGNIYSVQIKFVNFWKEKSE